MFWMSSLMKTVWINYFVKVNHILLLVWVQIRDFGSVNSHESVMSKILYQLQNNNIWCFINIQYIKQPNTTPPPKHTHIRSALRGFYTHALFLTLCMVSLNLLGFLMDCFPPITPTDLDTHCDLWPQAGSCLKKVLSEQCQGHMKGQS